MFYLIKNTKRGFTLVETIVAVAIFALAVVGLTGGLQVFSKAVSTNTKSVKAYFLIEEGIEAVRFLRDSGYDTYISSNINTGEKFISYSGGNWTIDSNYYLIDDEFERTLQVEDVHRDGTDDIVESGGTMDPDTAKVTIFVSWKQGDATTTRHISSYITNSFSSSESEGPEPPPG